MSVTTTASYRIRPWQVAVSHFIPNASTKGNGYEIFDQLLMHKTDGSGGFDTRHKPGSVLSNFQRCPTLYVESQLSRKKAHWLALENFFAEDITVLYGLQAVYSLAGRIFPKVKVLENVNEGLHGFTRAVFELGGAPSMLTPVDVSNQYQKNWLASLHKLQPVMNLLKEWVKVLSKSRNSMNVVRGKSCEQFKWFSIGTKVLGGPIKVALLDNCHLVKFGNKRHFLTNDDFDRLRSLLEGLSLYDHYWRTYTVPHANTNPKLVAASSGVLDLVCERMRVSSYSTCQKLTQAFDVNEHWCMAEIFSDITTVSIDEHRKKWEDKGLDVCFNRKAFLKFVEEFPPRERLQLCQVHRCFPAPDYDGFGMLERQRKLYEENIPLATDGGVTLVRILRNYKFYMMRAFRLKHHTWPGIPITPHNETEAYAEWPQKYRGNFGPDMVDQVDLNGDYTFLAHRRDYMDLMKDKAVLPEGVTGETTAEEYRKIPRPKKSQILALLSLKQLPDMQSLRNDISLLNFDVRADDKAETKKPNGRMFFMLDPVTRLLQSEYEASVNEYVTNLEQVMFSTKPTDYDRIMNSLGRMEPTGVDALMVSFDLSKWSPRITTALHEEIDLLWAEAFGEPHLAEMHRVVSEGNIHYFKNGFHHSMPKMGRDFEGFAGKKLTLYHLAVMHEVVGELARDGTIDLPARFMTFIDDGLLKLRKNGVWLPEQVQHAIHTMTQVYRQSHLEISWDKTFVSRKWSVFLNRLYYYATPVNLGVKAFMKILTKCEVAIPAVSDELETLAAKCTGAQEAGCMIYQIWFGYVLTLSDIVNKWALNTWRIGRQHAIHMFTPISHGGFGIRHPAMFGSTLSSHPLADGWAALRMILVRFPGYRQYLNDLGRLPVNEADDGKLLRSPWALRVFNPTLVQQKLLRAIETGLRKHKDLPGLAMILDLAAGRNADTLPCVHGKVVDLLIQKQLWDASREKALSNIAMKILKGNSAMCVVGPRKIIRVVWANKRNVQDVLASWR